MGKVFPLFRCLPEKLLRKLIVFLPPIVRSKVIFLPQRKLMGWIIVIPLTGDQLLSLPRSFIFKKLIQAFHKAKKLGVEIIGLGELIASITKGGEELTGKVEGVFIDNGKALTVGLTLKAIEQIAKLKKINLSTEKIAIVGAGGSIGRSIPLFLCEKNISLILIEKPKKVIELEKDFSFYKNKLITDDISAIKEAKIVVVATASTEEIIKPNFLKEKAIIYDITQPRNTSPDILKERKDVTVIDGGIVDTPMFDYGMDIGLKNSQAYACLIETIICSLENLKENFVGYPKPETVKRMLSLFEKYQKYFKLNIFQSFGKPLSEKLEFII
ncbi:MAG: hypothetical protein QME57_05070 [Patescibacteria group bacterium]|nr:hypothetical protein [Patescibacteria group bacterium]